MNERLKELEKQCYYDDNVRPDGSRISEQEFIIFDKQKFAELIVRECANFSYSYTYNDKNVEEWKEYGWDCMPGDLRNAIMEHFGVEE